MFDRILSDHSWPGDRPVWIGPNAISTWGDLAETVGMVRREGADLARRRVGLVFRPSPLSLATLALLDRLGCDTFLMDGRLGRDDAIRIGQELRLGAVLIGTDAPGIAPLERITLANELPGSGDSSVTILTSGTTGKPKAARHTWSSLVRPVRNVAHSSGPRWLLSYRPHLYAGLQVMLQCLVNGGTLVAPEPDASPPEIADLMRTARVAYASATPSYWRRLLHFVSPDVLGAVPLTQVTLGGEVVDQHVLDALHRVLPQARIVHIYATTELGRCFSVTDGRAGFPAAYLAGPTPDGVELRIDDDELVVRSTNAMLAYDQLGPAPSSDSGWFRTGDLVERAGDRIVFVGRRTDLINVGGSKVSPLEVERVIRAVPGVDDVRVFGKRSSLTGELVTCQVVAAADRDESSVREAIVAACLAGLAPYQRPRLIDFVPELVLEASGKLLRRARS
jgi:acyl-CoA synthetase (AMP-forming)/AMP-acid ligase II